MRVLLTNLFLLMLPFVLYYVYVKAYKPGMTFGETFTTQPVLWLLTAGAVLMFSYIVTQIDWRGEPRDGQYVPPRLENGKLLPGEVKPSEAK